MKSKTLSLIAPGSTVMFARDESTLGQVTQVCIATNNHVTYHVVWWNGRTRNSEWLEEFEVAPYESEPVRIGFLTNGNQ